MSSPDKPLSTTLPFPKVGVSLRVFEIFIEECGGASALKDLSTTEVCDRYMKPLTSQSRQSYCEMKAESLRTDVAIATVFISHAWKLKFLHVVDTLKSHFHSTQHSAIIWFDLFSNNQHAAVDLDFSWWSTTFKSAIAKFGRTVLVLSPWENPIPLSRAWCLYEIFCSINSGAKFEIAMMPVDEMNFIEAVKNDSFVVLKMIGDINLSKSEAFNPVDKDQIFDAVRSTVGFDVLNSTIFERLRVWVVNCIEHSIEVSPNEQDRLLLIFALAQILRQQGRFRECDAHYANCISAQRLLTDDPNILARFLNGFGYNLWYQARYEEAEPLLLESYAIRKDLFGLDNDITMTSLNTLCQLYRAQNRLELYCFNYIYYINCIELRTGQ